MDDSFSSVGSSDLLKIVGALETGRLAVPFTSIQLSRVIAGSVSTVLFDALKKMENHKFDGQQIAKVIRLIVHDRQNREKNIPLIELVTSGPDAPGITNRDTSVVVREMFSHAKKSVLVVGFAVYQGKQVFESLAQRLEENPELDVKLILNIERSYRDTTISSMLVAEFINNFKKTQWPTSSVLPSIYYDPRALSEDWKSRASLHAKCVVVDRDEVFISSANFTEAAQQRNVEVGTRIESEKVANRLVNHFQQMIVHKLVVKVL